MNNPATYNQAFPRFEQRSRIRRNHHWNGSDTQSISSDATRNQVAHQVDIGMELFTKPDSTRFTSDVLLTLCRLRDWAV